MNKAIEGKAAAPWGDAIPASGTGSKGATPALSPSTASTRTKWIALFAAPLAIGAASGSMAGALAALKLAQPAQVSEAAPAATIYETRALQGSITQLRGELAALKSSAEAAAKSANGQFARIGERVDRIERPLPAPARETTGARETTASVAPQPAAATTQPRSRNIGGWSVRNVYLGMALIESRNGETIEVMPGDTIRGIGRIEEIRKQDGRWVVVTSRGIIPATR